MAKHKRKTVLVPGTGKRSASERHFVRWSGIVDDEGTFNGQKIWEVDVTQNFGKYSNTGPFDTFVWNTTKFTWAEVVLAAELIEGLTSRRRSRNDQHSWLQEWQDNNPEKTKQLVHLICRVKGEKVYDESKEIDLKNVNITLEDVDLVTRRVLGTKQVSIVCEVEDEVFEETKLVEDYE
jgi:hypothetical protein